MNRTKKIIRNMGIVLLICFFFYYMVGYYLTKEACIRDSIRGLYCKEDQLINSVWIKPYDVTLVADLDHLTVSLISTEKVGFFYRMGNNSIGMEIDRNNPIDIGGIFDSDYGTVTYIYRNDKSIDEVHLVMEDGETKMVNEWVNDFILLSYDNRDKWMHTICRVYDDNGELVYETAY